MEKIKALGGKIRIHTNEFDIYNAMLGLEIQNQDHCLSEAWSLISEQRLEKTDAFGCLRGIQLSYAVPGDMIVEWEGGFYQNGIFACRMRVINQGSKDVLLKAVCPLIATGQAGGILHVAQTDPKQCVMLINSKWMGGTNHLTLPLETSHSTESYHVTALMNPVQKQGIVVGMGERTNTIVHMEATASENGFGLVISGETDCDLNGTPLRLRTGTCFTMNRIIMVAGNDIFTSFSQYGDCLAIYMGIRQESIRSACGIFCVYGQEKADTDAWEKIALTDERISELLDIADRYLKPYGLQYIKTQFGGASSGPSDGNGNNIGYRSQWTKEPTWPLPKEGQTLPELIKSQGFTPDTCVISQYHPHGIAAMCQEIHRRGYKNALVCRPYLNVIGGTEEMDNLCAEILRMATQHWGYDYLMLDFIDQDYVTCNDEITIAQSITRRISAIRNAVGTEIYIEACMVMPGCVLGLVDGYRPTSDWRGGTEERLAGLLTSMYFLHRKVFCLDSEFYDPDITPFVWANERKDKLRFLGSLERIKRWISFCGLTSYNLFTGGVIDFVTQERWDVFRKALPPNQKCAVPLDLGDNPSPELWRLEGTHNKQSYTVIGLFNWNCTQQKQVTVSFEKWRLNPEHQYIAFDFWAGRVFELQDGISFLLLPSACMILFVHASIGMEPIYLGSDRHVSDAYGLGSFTYNAEENRITGQTLAEPDIDVIHYVFIPDDRGPIENKGCDFEITQPRVVRVHAHTDSYGSCEWILWLTPSRKTI